MKIQKHLSHKRAGKVYHKYVVVIPEKTIKKAEFKEGDILEAETKKGEIKLRRK